jgi:hypothetical protein
VKRIIAASLAVACLCQTALAADVAVARVTYPSWTGFYVGADTGGSLDVGSGVDSAIFTTPALGGFPGGPTTLFSDTVRHAAPGWVWAANSATIGN